MTRREPTNTIASTSTDWAVPDIPAASDREVKVELRSALQQMVTLCHVFLSTMQDADSKSAERKQRIDQVSSLVCRARGLVCMTSAQVTLFSSLQYNSAGKSRIRVIFVTA